MTQSTRDQFPKYTNSSLTLTAKKPNSIQKWAEDLYRHFYKDIQMTHEKMLNFSNYQRDADQNYNEVPPYNSPGHH